MPYFLGASTNYYSGSIAQAANHRAEGTRTGQHSTRYL